MNITWLYKRAGFTWNTRQALCNAIENFTMYHFWINSCLTGLGSRSTGISHCRQYISMVWRPVHVKNNKYWFPLSENSNISCDIALQHCIGVITLYMPNMLLSLFISYHHDSHSRMLILSITQHSPFQSLSSFSEVDWKI